MNKKTSCLCCQANIPLKKPRQCPLCGHIFQGNGWGGNNVHWLSQHEKIIRYETFWESLCSNHKDCRHAELRVTPIIRWAGSKHRLLNELLRFVPLSFNRYFEPFAGSARLFFRIIPKKATLNDINSELMQFYSSIRAHPISIYNKAVAYPRTKSQYVHLRSMAPNQLSEIDRAARFFYINRFCFNGLYRTNKEGHFNVPMGIDTGEFPSPRDVVSAAQLLRNVELINKDFEDALSDIGPNDFIYLDPPYYTPLKRRRNEYGNNCFTTDDLPRLLRTLKYIDSRGATFLLSYANDPTLLDQLHRYRVHKVRVRRTISGFIKHRINTFEIIATNRIQK
jgi:DNA adenine methylase